MTIDAITLSDWYLTVPVDARGSNTGEAAMIKSLSGYSSTWFHENADGSFTFTADVDGATTSGTKYARSELREMSGTSLAAWNLATGGTMTATVTVNEAPVLSNGTVGKLVIGQIHGKSDELVRLYWDNGSVYFKNDQSGSDNSEHKFELLDANGGKANVSLGETFSYVISASGDHLVVGIYVDGTLYSSQTAINSVWQSDTLYFKAGVYLGVNETQGTGEGQVTISDLDYSHSVDDGFDGVTGTAATQLTGLTTYTNWTTASAAITNISGGSGNDNLVGTSGADRLNGYAGNDTMAGAAGDDRYYVDSVGDVVIEKAGKGTDTVYAKVTYTLSDNVENLVQQGTAAINGVGNALDNRMQGNDAGNVLNGMAGADKLFGGAGNDTLNGGDGADRLSGQTGNDRLVGGAGADRFIFDTALDAINNVDVISDFSRADRDKITLSSAIFDTIGGAGSLSAGYFHAGAKAESANDHILYDASTGWLSYDADGNGSGAAIHFATLQPHTTLGASDILVV